LFSNKTEIKLCGTTTPKARIYAQTFAHYVNAQNAEATIT